MGKIPKLVSHVAAAIYKANRGKKGWDAVRALATAISRLQAYGYLKKGTLTLTKKGRLQTQKRHPKWEKASMDLREFKELLRKAGRKRRREKSSLSSHPANKAKRRQL